MKKTYKGFDFDSLIAGRLEGYQVEGIKYALLHHYHLNCYDMGLGKTLISLVVAFFHQRNKKFPCLIVCPSYLSANWEVEINKWSKAPKTTLRLQSKRECKAYLKNPKEIDFVIISYNMFREFPKLLAEHRMLICDEVHYLKSDKAQVTVAAHNALDDYRPDVFMGLTGTPIKNAVPEFFSLLGLCGYNSRGTSGLNIFDHFGLTEFKKTFCWETKMNLRGRHIYKYHGFRNKPKLIPFLKNKFIRKTNEVLGLTEPIHEDVIIDYSDDPQLLEDWENFNKGIGRSVNSTSKKDSALKVTEATMKFVFDLLKEKRGPVVIVSYHPQAITQMMKKAAKNKYKADFIHGKVSPTKRHNIVEKFQAGGLDLLFLSLAGSTGLTLTKSNIMVFNDEDWVPENNSQIRGRIHRKGQTKRCHYYYMRGSKSAAIIGAKLRGKSKVIKEVLHGQDTKDSKDLL